MCFGHTETSCSHSQTPCKPHPVGLMSICTINSNKEWNKNKNPIEGTREVVPAEIPSHGEDGDIGLLHAERQGTERRHIRRGVLAPLHEGRAGEGTAHAGTYGLCPPTLRHGEQSEPACAQGERRGFRHGEDGVPHTRGTYRRSAEFNPLMTAGYDS